MKTDHFSTALWTEHSSGEKKNQSPDTPSCGHNGLAEM